MDIQLILPFPPTINSYYVQTKRGRFISKTGRKFRLTVAQDVREQLGSMDIIEDRLLVEVTLFVPDKRIRDVDNYMKPLLDACTEAGVWEDDRLIDQLFIYRGALVPKGRTLLTISEAGPLIPDTKKPCI